MQNDNRGFLPTPVMVQPVAYPQTNVNQTTVIIQQPQTTAYKGQRGWSSGICGCCEDCCSCVLVWFFSECYLCYLYHEHDEFLCTPYCVPMSLLLLRTKQRSQHGIRGSIIEDCCKTYWCYLCAMCQLKRDMDYVIETKGSLN